MQKVENRNIKRYEQSTYNATVDLLAVEEPLEIRIGYGLENKRKQKSVAVTMRTPGDDENLAIGFLFSENVIDSFNEVLSIKPCINKESGELEENILRVELHPDKEVNLSSLERNFYTTSSCGVCGKASIESIETSCSFQIPNNFKVKKETILELPKKLNDDQLVFSITGGIHATAIFNAKGDLFTLREDVGRHNAFDKSLGAMLSTNSIPLFQNIALVSGRTSFELVQKAAMAGIPILCAIGAPSSLAAQLAEDFNITLIGFLKKDKFNIYTHPERII